MEDRPKSGYIERAHTADWALEVWAQDEPALLVEAARGMYALMGALLRRTPRLQRDLRLEATDPEGRLVVFLGELLFLAQHEGLAFDRLKVTITGEILIAELAGAPLERIVKEIKAVTYHNLVVRRSERGLETVIVFDV